MIFIVSCGYSHTPNFLKFRILDALIKSKEPLTTRDIEGITGVQYTTISAAMSRYQKIQKKSGKVIKLPYIRRLPTKAPNGLYRYKITKKGIEAYTDLFNRIRWGMDLNRVARKHKRRETYVKRSDRTRKKFETIEDFELSPEQLLPYYSLNASVKQYTGDKSLILLLEQKVKEQINSV